MKNIQLSLAPSVYQELLQALEQLPYKQVHALIKTLEEQAQKGNENAPQPIHLKQDSGKNFQIGDRVRAKWLQGAAWFTGKIMDIKNGQYFIKYDDGDEEWTTAAFIELIKAGSAKENYAGSFKVGDRIQARWQGGDAWFDGTIAEVKGEKFFIQYDDGDEEWTTADFIIIEN